MPKESEACLLHQSESWRIEQDGKGLLYRISQKRPSDRGEGRRQFQDDMTPARAAGMRSDRIDGKQPSNEEKRKAEKAANMKAWTIDRLFKEYKKGRAKNKGMSVDTGRYEKHIKPVFGDREPKSIAPLDVDRLRIRLLKKKSPQTVKHVLNLLTWIINFGANKNLCEGISFKIKKPSVNNETTEDLTPAQLKRLMEAIDKDPNVQVGNLMKLALFTGMRANIRLL